MIIPVILSGGPGSRLWPLSRQSHPKPFLKLPDGESLLQKTFTRACLLEEVKEIITITNQAYFLKSRPEYQAQQDEIAPQQTFILEPVGRDTASAIAMASLKTRFTYGEEAILLILPADHLIENGPSFVNTCQKAFALARQGHIVTFGIEPTHPETGFGYIQRGADIAEHESFKVEKFIEKPPIEQAIQFFEAKRFYWNAGIFCFKVGVIVEEYSQLAPALLQQAEVCWERSRENAETESILKLDAESYHQIESISFDYALLEKSKRTAVVPCDFGWQDIGSWKAYKDLHVQDKHGNSFVGDSVMVDTQHTFIHSPDKLVAAVGLRGIIVVDTPDALLVSSHEHVQEVKSIVDTLKKNDHKSYFAHMTEQKPWGAYTILDEGQGFKVKRIVIRAGEAISLQSHQHRSEHWVIVQGTAKVRNEHREFIATKDQAIYIPKACKHRITNIANENLIIIEVQIGEYLGEDDIERFEDNYGRVS